ncbi:ATP-binding cassette domain-containing protein [Zafaria sp. Z1313]|uniref:ATP-binding cassette domain-containing protein n=1 Tax=unclassified Zafaria TaxID=2828765 RepID=UPI002E767973|nr:ATP-binding cassette domain-containing protein [Zafaria sp. J156]MEE1621306.1 ATP-binding cassette domain-containing protein [Zafaria sp. J156]
MNSDTIIHSRGLAKRFTSKGQDVQAVAGLDLDVARGELLAFLGPNGAGKSTSLRLLTTLLRPSAGTAAVAGCDILADPAGVRSRIGYVGQGTSGSFSQRVRDELLSQGAFYGLGRREAARRTDELIESLELGPIATRTVQQLSGGQKRRLDIALGLVHAPELLFLDEPSTGLDPQSRANLWEHILQLRRSHGTTVFLTTHYLEEADRYAERVMVMDRGQVIADDTADALKAGLAGDAVTIGFADPARAQDARAALSSAVGAEARQEEDDAGRPVLAVTVPDGAGRLPDIVRALDAAGLPPRSAAAVPPTLDDVFLALTGRSLREADLASEDAGDADTPTTHDTSTTHSTPNEKAGRP